MTTQASDELVIAGDGMPEITKLWNDRFRLEFLCTTSKKTESWYGGNIDKLLPPFGTAMDESFANDNWTPPDDVTYPDMLLIETSVRFVPSIAEHLVTLTYETLTDTLVPEVDDAISETENGLRTVTRVLIAKSGVAYTNSVGDADFGGYLAKFKVENTDAYTRVEEVWIAAGVLRTSLRNLAEGVVEATTSFFVVEGTVVGPITARTEGNVDGVPTIDVTSMQDKNGNALGASASPVSEFDMFVDFRYPGEVSIASDTDTINNTATGEVNFTFNSHWYSLKGPATTPIQATVYVFFQNTGSITGGDLGWSGAQGVWAPNEWARGVVEGLGTNFGLTTVKQIAQDKFFSEYTTVLGGDNTVSGVGDFADAVGSELVEGNLIFPGASFSITVSGGPGKPDGKRYLTQGPTITPAFDDLDGNQVWKKTIIVATIPARA